MARLCTEAGADLRDFDEIVATLGSLGVTLGRCPVDDDPALKALLDQNVLSDPEKDQLLKGLTRGFQSLKEQLGGQACDLVVLHPETPDLAESLATYRRCHVHPDNEIRYVVDGEGVFGVVLPDGSQAELTVEAPEYVCVPKGLEHWFRLSDMQRIKCVRYFSEVDAWEADFTSTEIRLANN